mmetsp:Transcript_28495/g.43733  ORF Transcript_28495/g.43733 Transcript_28495/m.43733 type:complete len:85 (-) Transcript_28495:78-332(-)
MFSTHVCDCCLKCCFHFDFQLFVHDHVVSSSGEVPMMMNVFATGRFMCPVTFYPVNYFLMLSPVGVGSQDDPLGVAFICLRSIL